MKQLVLALLIATPAWADQAESLCAQNPAYAPAVMLAIVRSQLQHDHDPALDTDTPDALAVKASAQGISECAATLRGDPSTATALSGLDKTDRAVGWDAYNTACSDRSGSRGQCIATEIAADKALKHMVATDTPSGAKTLVQACGLMFKEDPAMADWRSCVDQGLAVHASQAKVAQCKLSVSWHQATTGAEAARSLTACLRG